LFIKYSMSLRSVHVWLRVTRGQRKIFHEGAVVHDWTEEQYPSGLAQKPATNTFISTTRTSFTRWGRLTGRRATGGAVTVWGKRGPNIPRLRQILMYQFATLSAVTVKAFRCCQWRITHKNASLHCFVIKVNLYHFGGSDN